MVEYNYILAMSRGDLSLDQVGGKSLSLSRLVNAGFTVPPGFLLSTEAYRLFVDANGLATVIDELVSAEGGQDEIRTAFSNGKIPDDLVVQITEAFGKLQGAVAVRSSATAEDLPDLSFAGQQDTYLNVQGEDALVAAIKGCWASLWTDRAIEYRRRMGVDHEHIAMGVVVQQMVEAAVSGVLFTANPATGDRGEMIINASYGLGEAIVGGEVTPDTFTIDRDGMTVRASQIGAKSTMVVSGTTGTDTREVPVSDQHRASVSVADLQRLGQLASKVERHFDGVPQDIEWVLAEGEFQLVQSRPITNLPDAPLKVSWESPWPDIKLVRRQVVENMPDPLSPLFDDLYLNDGLDGGMEGFFGILDAPVEILDFISRPMFRSVNGYAYCIASYNIAWGKLPKLIGWYVTKMWSAWKTMRTYWQDEGLPNYLKSIDDWQDTELKTFSDKELWQGIRRLSNADALYWFAVTMAVALAKVADGLLNWFVSSRLVPGQLTSGDFLRGFPSKTISAQEELERIADQIAENDTLRALVDGAEPVQLITEISAHPEGQAVAAELNAYLRQYGHQAFTLDFVEPTQGEDPTALLSGLQRIVGRTDKERARRARVVEERDRATAATRQSLGPTRRWLFDKFLNWAVSTGPDREEALFYIGAAWPQLRQMVSELGGRWVERDTLDAEDDFFYLRRDEVDALLAGNELAELRQSIAERRDLREARRRIHPPPMVPPDAKFKMGFLDLTRWETQKRNAAEVDTLEGFAVSPGQTTGVASVIMSPADFEKMQPDSILVCPTTTPAWTPLFGQAKALVTDVGGILAHGSIVAREYGIPAVLGTGNITERVNSGQHLEVDGSAGTVRLID